jgi:hypothetical protein
MRLPMLSGGHRQTATRKNRNLKVYHIYLDVGPLTYVMRECSRIFTYLCGHICSGSENHKRTRSLFELGIGRNALELQ